MGRVRDSVPGDTPIEHVSRPDFYPLVGKMLLIVEGAHVGRNEGFDAVSQPSSRLSQRYPRLQPSCRRRVAAVVDPERSMSDGLECPVP